MQSFWQALKTQRWDDHRYYHHSRINQTLHLVSAGSFIVGYFMLFRDPVAAAMIGWLVAMVTRQAGHFFFEPKGYDAVNQATHEHKEHIKVGYNLRRKAILLAIWIAVPLVLWLNPGFFGLFTPQRSATFSQFVRHTGQLWLAVGVGGLVFRTLQLCIIRDLQTGLVWLTKILTDPFHDVMLYHKAPLRLLRGELIDPMIDRHAA